MSYALPPDRDTLPWVAQFHYGQGSGSSSDQWGPSHSGAIAVVTFISLCNVAGSAGDGAQIIQTPSGIVVHQAAIGAGTFDRFPLLCQVVLRAGDLLALFPSGSSAWHWTLSGYWLPDAASRLP